MLLFYYIGVMEHLCWDIIHNCTEMLNQGCERHDLSCFFPDHLPAETSAGAAGDKHVAGKPPLAYRAGLLWMRKKLLT